MSAPAKYTYRPYVGDRFAAACHRDECCVRCGKPLVNRVPLELDQRIEEYHDFGGVPPEQSQGWFDFGPDCANALRKRARAAILADPAATTDERVRAALAEVSP